MTRRNWRALALAVALRPAALKAAEPGNNRDDEHAPRSTQRRSGNEGTEQADLLTKVVRA